MQHYPTFMKYKRNKNKIIHLNIRMVTQHDNAVLHFTILLLLYRVALYKQQHVVFIYKEMPKT